MPLVRNGSMLRLLPRETHSPSFSAQRHVMKISGEPGMTRTCNTLIKGPPKDD
jgi:hypothetical protein